MSVVRLGRYAMGTFFEAVLCGDDEARLRAAAEEAFALIDRLEAQMSLYLPTSEVCAINEGAYARPVRVEPRLYGLLRRARELWEITDGAFDVCVAPLTFGGVRGQGERGGTRFLELRDGAVRFHRRGIGLDLGAIGKGHALDRAAERLRARGISSAFLHGGTSTALAIGAPPEEEGWPVGLVDPRDPERRFGSLLLKDRALSVSSPLGRMAPDGTGHVLDPRTGEPVARPAAWALAESAADTDALATAFVVLGPEARVPEGCGAMWLDGAGLRCAGVEPALVDEPRAGTTRRDFLKGAAAAATAFGVGLGARRARAEDPRASRELKVALVGAGEQGTLLLEQMARMKGITVAAVCDLRDEALAEAVKIAGRDVETYKDFAYLLDEEEIDALVCATPTHLHAPVAIAALERGLPVYVEAPLARSIADCRAIARAAAASDRVCQVGHLRRTSKLYPHALDHIGSGAIGKVLQVRAQWNRKVSWRRPGELDRARDWRLFKESSGGLPLEVGAHVFDLANRVLGAVPEAVAGFGGLLKWTDGRETDDSVQVLLRYPGGQQVNFEASLVNSYGGERETIVGDAAAILLLDQRKGLLFKEADTVAAGWEQYAKTEMLGGARGILLDAEATKYVKHAEGEEVGPDGGKADVHAALEAFFRKVRDRKETNPCDAVAGLRAAVTGIVAAEAVAKGETVRFTKEHFEV